MKKTTNHKRRPWMTLLAQILILFCYMKLFSACYSFGCRVSGQSGIEGVIRAVFGGLI